MKRVKYLYSTPFEPDRKTVQSLQLTHTLSFGLDIETGSGDDLQDGCLVARRIRNEANRLDKEGWEWNDTKPTVVDTANHVKNTSQLIVDKELGEIETYLDHKFQRME